jgi:hypothetical protein
MTRWWNRWPNASMTTTRMILRRIAEFDAVIRGGDRPDRHRTSALSLRRRAPRDDPLSRPQAAAVIIAETEAEAHMARFPSVGHLAS